MPRPARLSLELLETFVVLAENEGDATRTAEALKVNQPSVSKRLSAIRQLTSERTGQSWLIRKGKRWQLSPEGQRVRVVVTDMIRRYEQLERFIASGAEGTPIISIACGQQAATGFVRTAIERFLSEHAECRVRLSTVRGRQRIEGVAGGLFDVAIVTDSPSAIRRVARREVFIAELFEDHFVLAANPSAKSDWGSAWNSLRTGKPVPAKELLELPLILPEPDSTRRQQFDDWCHRATGKSFNVILEVGGWQTIMEFVESGLGIGLVPESAFQHFQEKKGSKVSIRSLDAKEFPPDAVRLIAWKAHGKEEPDISELGMKFITLLRMSNHG